MKRPLELLTSAAMMGWSGRQLWIASIVLFEVLALSYFVLHAPSIDETALHNVDVMRNVQGSPNVRQCLSTDHRDRRFTAASTKCVTVRDRQRALVELVYEAASLAERLGITYWLDGATLRSQHRTGDAEFSDLTGNVAVMVEGFDVLRSKPTIALPEGYELNVFQGQLHKMNNRDIPARLVEKRFGFYLDFVVFDETQEQLRLLGPPPSAHFTNCANCPSITGAKGATLKLFSISEGWILPTRTCRFNDFEAKCPAHAARYLSHLYGDNFVKPIISE